MKSALACHTGRPAQGPSKRVTLGETVEPTFPPAPTNQHRAFATPTFPLSKDLVVLGRVLSSCVWVNPAKLAHSLLATQTSNVQLSFPIHRDPSREPSPVCLCCNKNRGVWTSLCVNLNTRGGGSKPTVHGFHADASPTLQAASFVPNTVLDCHDSKSHDKEAQMVIEQTWPGKPCVSSYAGSSPLYVCKHLCRLAYRTSTISGNAELRLVCCSAQSVGNPVPGQSQPAAMARASQSLLRTLSSNKEG